MPELTQFIAKQKGRIDALEAAHADLAQRALKVGGTWTRGTMYSAGDGVQHDGSLWGCIETHVAGASFAHDFFVLQVKRGRDGKDLR